jgi:hypothetical protein
MEAQSILQPLDTLDTMLVRDREGSGLRPAVSDGGGGSAVVGVVEGLPESPDGAGAALVKSFAHAIWFGAMHGGQNLSQLWIDGAISRALGPSCEILGVPTLKMTLDLYIERQLIAVVVAHGPSYDAGNLLHQG